MNTVLYQQIVEKTLDLLQQHLYNEPTINIPPSKENDIARIIETNIYKFINDPEYSKTIFESVSTELGLDSSELVFESLDEETLKNVIQKAAEILEQEIFGDIVIETAINDSEELQRMLKETYLGEEDEDGAPLA